MNGNMCKQVDVRGNSSQNGQTQHIAGIAAAIFNIYIYIK